VGIIQLYGQGIVPALKALTGEGDWPVSRVRLSDLAGIDQGLVVRLREDWAQLMPHGGTRVVQKLLDRLRLLGGMYEPEPAPRLLYPEANSDLEAEMLACLAKAVSPAAIDCLLAQPALWRQWINGPSRQGAGSILDVSEALRWLLNPACVVVVGRPNVGKSTLTNRMLGRAASLVADLPGTTRDWVAGLADLGGTEPFAQAVTVRWIDTPGVRVTDDPMERRAIDLASEVIRRADILVTMRDAQIGWPDAEAMTGRVPDIRVVNKIDRDEAGPSARDVSCEPFSSEQPLRISALGGDGVPELEQRVIERLGLVRLSAPRLWAFSAVLREALLEDRIDDRLTRYVWGD
jgi:small GTP-binding protein